MAARTGERLVNIANVIFGQCSYELEDDETIGFCFPVHGWRPPRIVKQFIRKLTIVNAGGHFCWALCTAGDSIGLTMDILADELSEKGIFPDSLFTLIMPESYIGLPKMDVDTPQKEVDKKNKSAQQLVAYADAVIERRRGVQELVKGSMPWAETYVVGGVFDGCLISDRPFHVDKKKCIGCGKCAMACPVGNMKAGEGQAPKWLHTGRCMTCFACYHHCPTHAINWFLTTKNKGQYYFDKKQ